DIATERGTVCEVDHNRAGDLKLAVAGEREGLDVVHGRCARIGVAENQRAVAGGAKVAVGAGGHGDGPGVAAEGDIVRARGRGRRGDGGQRDRVGAADEVAQERVA